MTTKEKLAEIAYNLWWTWRPDVGSLFEKLNPEAYRSSRNNPVAALLAADERVLNDQAFAHEVAAAHDAFHAYLEGPEPYADGPRVSYFCMEFGLHESLPIYAGGLGILAGDHTKAASDLSLPFTGIGLFVSEGYFKQHFDAQGRQQHSHPRLDPATLPIRLATNGAGNAITVTVHLGTRPLHLRAWELTVGRVKLYLLDADFDANDDEGRAVTRRLYQGGTEGRIQQEIILGIGGVRLLRALNVTTDVYHMNEGHCAFLALELLRECMSDGRPRREAEAEVRRRCVFTTHTPVREGHDRFSPSLFNEAMTHFREWLGLTEKELLAYGRVNPDDEQEDFTMTVLGLKLARKANGVSALNGEVARRQWQELYPDRPVSEVPIGHVTNGVHLPTWTVLPAKHMLDAHFADWRNHRADAAFWTEQARHLSDEDLWAYRNMLRQDLIDYVNEVAPKQSLPQAPALDPDALTIGFARRFATYKRAPLIFSDIEQAVTLFTHAQRPVQLIFAGKAHPADERGQGFIQEIYEMTQHPALRGRVVFLEGYDMEIARYLVSGCDVWLNNPRRPLEASGTSGQKITLHGGLNLSILDGWWPEGYNGKNGWAIGTEQSADPKEFAVQDEEDQRFLYETLREQVIPEFYDRDADGRPARWIARIREALSTLPATFSAERMVRDYIEEMYKA